jgi:iron(III) transport system substrate-binding protein
VTLFGRPSAPRVRTGALTLLAALAIASLGSGCGDGRTPVVVYSPHGPVLLRLMEEEFEKRHPEIDVRWLDMGSQEVYDRVRSETANPQAGVWYGGPSQIFARGAADGLLAPYRPEWADAVPERSGHPQDLYFATYRTAPVLVYNTDLVPAEEAPRDWEDLLDPRWNDKILIREPLASGTMRTFFSMVLARSLEETGTTDRGFDWLRRLDAQTKEYINNPVLMMEKLVRGEGLVTIWELTDVLLRIRQGSPLDYNFPTSGVPVIDDSIALVKGAPEPEAARRFIDFVGSLEAQELAAREALRLPARDDMPSSQLPDWARKVLDEMVPAEVDWDVIRSHGAEWMRTWDRTVRGQGTD